MRMFLDFFFLKKFLKWTHFPPFRPFWTPCRPSSTHWPFTDGRASMWTSACRAGGTCPGTRFLRRCPTRRATIPWWDPPCSTRVTSRKPRRTPWAMGTSTRTPSVSSQKVNGLSAAATAPLCTRAGNTLQPTACSWCSVSPAAVAGWPPLCLKPLFLLWMIPWGHLKAGFFFFFKVWLN